MSLTTGQRRRIAWAPKLTAVLDLAARSHARAVMVLAVTSLLCFLPGFFAIPPIDRDEARFAQASKQMVETGDYLDIRFQEEVRYKKPVGIYWLQAAVVGLAEAVGVPEARTQIWLYRIPSLAGAVGAVLLTYWAALAFVSRRAALIAALMMASCLVLAVEARLAKTDAMLLLMVTAAMGALARCYLPHERMGPHAVPAFVPAAVFWTALAAGVLLKGPVILLFVGLAVASLVISDRSARWLTALRPMAGIVWFAVLVLPWFVAILSMAGKTFIAESAGRDMLAKVFSGQEGHGAPPGYYFLLFWVTFWPGATLAALAAPAAWAGRREPETKFLLAWLLPSWIVFELVVTKLPHYVLPLYPAVAILIAGAMQARSLSGRPVLARGASWWFVFPLLLALGILAATAMIGRPFEPWAWPLIGAGLVLGLFAWRSYDGARAEESVMRAIAAAILMWIAGFGMILPGLSTLFPAATLARTVRDSGCAHPLAASTLGFQEPSLIFLLGTSTRLTDGPGAAEFLRLGECRFAFVEERDQKTFAEHAEAVGLRYSRGPRVDAVNVGTGRPLRLFIYRSRGPS